MSPEKQRIAIAEACGYEKPHQTVMVRGRVMRAEVVGKLGDDPFAPVPDYLNDLNAMHESLRAQSRPFNERFAIEMWSLAERRKVFMHELSAKDWADCFVLCLEMENDK